MLKTVYFKMAEFLPAIFFFSGFVWDALTIGHNVATSDLLIFTAYLLAAGVLLFVMSRPRFILADQAQIPKVFRWFFSTNWPYLGLQFLFGSLLSALFILYFKSASHALAILMAVLLGVLLIANEFLENAYRRFTLSWTLFGLCAMLLFNFLLPFLLGSVHAIWFYLSTLLGAAMVIFLYSKTPQNLGSILPVWLIAGFLMFAYAIDMIPPVPLVKRDIAIAYDIKKVEGHYYLTQQRVGLWALWSKASNKLTLSPGQRVYCFSSIFAPAGLETRLYHNWQKYSDKQGWQSQSRVGFDLSGGRQNGYRGYTYKTNLSPGKWRVRVETENEKTIAIQKFTVREGNKPPRHIIFKY
ncbi:MAG: DUF2914 domain-containing protein [Methylophilus sp.]|nr:DUF2914 domain-containing protein [Methylophilus sp.]